MNAHDKFQAYSRPSVKASFDPYLNRLLQSIASEDWLDASLDLEALGRLVKRYRLDEKLRESERMPI